MTSIAYDPARLRFPDVSAYHSVNGWKALKVGLGKAPMLPFKVGNGAAGGILDSTYKAHLAGCEANGIIPIGYWFGPWHVADFLAAFPPAPNRIAVCDFETEKNGPTLSVAGAVAFVEALKAAWGRWPWFYGHSQWIALGQPAGTSVAQCPYWGPTYGASLEIPNGVGSPVAHQYTDGVQGPKPWTFPGVSGQCDVNSLLVPFSTVQQQAGGGDVTLSNADLTQIAVAEGYSDMGSAKVQNDISKAINDVITGKPKRSGQSSDYNSAFDKTATLLAGGTPSTSVAKHQHQTGDPL